DGGTPILGYFVERRNTSSSRWYRVTPNLLTGTSYHSTDLVDGNKYEFRVVSENKVGQSQPSMPSTQVLAKDPWDKPSRPSELEITEISRRSCRLSWRPPTDDGGDSIVGYVIEYKIAGTFKWIRANDLEKVIDSSYKVSGLQEDFEYEFRVAAENRGGIG
ncbi:hypothetical protein CAPTEDRAFT_39154, partial [Capitella teleta]